MMLKISVILLFLIFFLIILPLSFFYKNRNKKLEKKIIVLPSRTSLEEQASNPDLNTFSWDLHKVRLEKFRRSQYKGLTFFKCSENRIYYLSEKGDKVYC